LKRALLFITVVVVLIVGGFISNSISKQGSAALPGLKVQTENPEASVMTVTPDKGALFFIFSAVALGSLVGMGATLAIVFWLINRQVTIVKDKPTRASKAAKSTPPSATPSST
jgi:hypothetical protein